MLQLNIGLYPISALERLLFMSSTRSGPIPFHWTCKSTAQRNKWTHSRYHTL